MPVTGTALLDRVKVNHHRITADFAVQMGYFIKTPTGIRRANWFAFQNALRDAQFTTVGSR
jgi:hypothetical protein